MPAWSWMLILAIILIIIGLIIYFVNSRRTSGWVWLFWGLGVLFLILSIVFVIVKKPAPTATTVAPESQTTALLVPEPL